MRIFPRRHIYSRASISQRREYPGESSDDDNINRRPYRDWRPPERGRYPSQSGRPLDQRGYPNKNGRPGRGGYLGGGLPNGDEGPPGDGGPLGGQGPPGPQGPSGPVRPIIVQTPQKTLDTSALENTFDSVGQSMLQLARVQDQTNRQLQQRIQ